ncbi:MAG: glycosyltransferase family 4 protein [Adhaeribacter sp.]
MKRMNVLLLGWEFPPVINGEVGNSCFRITKSLANRVNLSLILPKSDPDFILRNVELTGLNNVDLGATSQNIPPVPYSAFADTERLQADLPLYGAPTPTQVQTEPHPQQAPLPGETVSVGEFAAPTTFKTITQEVEELYVFGQKDLNLVDYNSQVIHYARYASRLAAQKEYEVVYAYDWMTFLAGIELKLVSGKPLVLHMHSLSADRGGPDSKAWIYELEKQALEKADAIIAVNDRIAGILVADYGISASRITSMNMQKNKKPEPAAEQISDEIYNMEVSESNHDLVKTMLPVKEESSQDWDKAAKIVWQVLEEVTQQEQI